MTAPRLPVSIINSCGCPGKRLCTLQTPIQMFSLCAAAHPRKAPPTQEGPALPMKAPPTVPSAMERLGARDRFAPNPLVC